MEDLNLLVQLAGGEQTTVRRLKEAGFKSPADIATGDPEQLQATCGLSAAAVRRLIKVAGEHVSGTARAEGDLSILRRNETGTVRNVASSSPRRRKAKKRAQRSSDATPVAAAVVGPVDVDPPAVSPLAAGASHPDAATAATEPEPGVSLIESNALTGEVPAEGWRQASFWRFG